MSAAASGCRVLVIGLDPYRVPGPWDPQPVSDAIQSGMSGLAARGIDAEACLVGLDESDDIEARITTALQSQQWDCVVVGGGIRESAELMELFESIINLVHSYAPSAEIAFNGAPDRFFDAVARRLPVD